LRIESIAYAHPIRRVTNEALVEEIERANSKTLSPQDRERLVRRLNQLFARVGAAARYLRSGGERAIDFGVKAAREAIGSAGAAPSDVDLIIYAGVRRAFIEPATAGLFQAELGLSRATGFDVGDACASWLRSVDLAGHLLDSGAYRNALILTCEFNFHEYGSMTLDSLSEFQGLEAGCTVGEAATATFLTRDDASSVPSRFYASFRTLGQYADLCQIPLPGSKQFATSRDSVDQPSLRFFANARELNARVTRALKEHFVSDKVLQGQEFDVSFGHSAGVPAARRVGRKLGLPTSKHFEIFPEYGNTVSSSIPLAMALASEQGRLQRGDRALAIVGSAGVTTGFGLIDY